MQNMFWRQGWRERPTRKRTSREERLNGSTIASRHASIVVRSRAIFAGYEVICAEDDGNLTVWLGCL